jgi:hypothetical protein
VQSPKALFAKGLLAYVIGKLIKVMLYIITGGHCVLHNIPEISLFSLA